MSRVVCSEYMIWAKTKSQSRYNLATSGVTGYTLGELGVTLDDLEINGPSWYGYEPLQQALAGKCGVRTENVVAAIGTSMANHLAMAALIEPGDEVIIEHPVYDPVTAAAQYLGANVKWLPRRFEDAFRVDTEVLGRMVSPRTRLIVLTNLHNPSSVSIDEATLKQVAEIASTAGARVLVDEVYLEAMFERTPRSAFHMGEHYVVTSSLTKVYGLSGLRCGWVLASADLAERMWRLNDLFGNIPAHPAERLSVIALAKLEKIAARSKSLLSSNRILLDRFLDSRDDIECVRPGFGTVVFPRLKRGKTDEFCALLRSKYETTVVPGRFFDMPEHFRIGIGGETKMVENGLDQLSRALDEYMGDGT